MSDPSWRTGSIAHYLEPAYYDKCYAKRRHDVDFYLSLVEERCPHGQVLEYGCGNGRIALPLARSGVEVYGLDLSRPMLNDFRARLAHEPPDVRKRVTLRKGDMRTFRTRRRFDLVLCTFNTFLHLYTHQDVLSFFRRVRSHLRPGASLVFDASLPVLEELNRDPGHPYSIPRLRVPPSHRLVRYSESFDYDKFTQVLKITMLFEPLEGDEQPWATLLTHRQFFPQEIMALAQWAGFELVKIWPDFVDGPPQDAIDAMVWEFRPASSTAR